MHTKLFNLFIVLLCVLCILSHGAIAADCPPGLTCGTSCCKSANLCVNGQCCDEDKICARECCADAQICQDGKCVCPNGNTFCSPTCVDTTSDIQNCGSCGNICPSDNVCVNGACVDCAVNSDCVSDWLLNPETGEAIGAAGTCIDNVCYVCADGCLSQSYCSSFETTGGGAPALCKTDSSCGTNCKCCRPRDL